MKLQPGICTDLCICSLQLPYIGLSEIERKIHLSSNIGKYKTAGREFRVYTAVGQESRYTRPPDGIPGFSYSIPSFPWFYGRGPVPYTRPPDGIRIFQA